MILSNAVPQQHKTNTPQTCSTFSGTSSTVETPDLLQRKKLMQLIKTRRHSGTALDKLFLLNSNFTDSRLKPENQLYYCPFNAMLEGVLKYYPEIKQKLEITYIDFPRPRKQIIELLGEENQNMPILIIERRDIDLIALNIRTYNDIVFLTGSDDIVRYFSLVFLIPLPHP